MLFLSAKVGHIWPHFAFFSPSRFPSTLLLPLLNLLKWPERSNQIRERLYYAGWGAFKRYVDLTFSTRLNAKNNPISTFCEYLSSWPRDLSPLCSVFPSFPFSASLRLFQTNGDTLSCTRRVASSQQSRSQRGTSRRNLWDFFSNGVNRPHWCQ